MWAILRTENWWRIIETQFNPLAFLASGKLLHEVRRIGSAPINTSDGAIKLKGVKYVLSMYKNLILVGSFANEGNTIIFTNTL